MIVNTISIYLNDRRKLAEKNGSVRAGGGRLFALRIMVSIKMGLMENAEKENIGDFGISPI